MTHDEYQEWITDVHCSLFHVQPTDLDDVHKIRLDQLIVLRSIAAFPEVLQHIELHTLLLNLGVV